MRWVIGLRVVRVVVWGSRRGTKSGPCRDTCNSSAPAIIGVGPAINVSTTIDVRIRSAGTNGDVTRRPPHGNIACRACSDATTRWSADCGTPARADRGATTERSAHSSTPAGADRGATTHRPAHGAAAGGSPRHSAAHRPADGATTTRSTDSTGTPTAAIDPAATSEASTTPTAPTASKRPCVERQRRDQ